MYEYTPNPHWRFVYFILPNGQIHYSYLYSGTPTGVWWNVFVSESSFEEIFQNYEANDMILIVKILLATRKEMGPPNEELLISYRIVMDTKLNIFCVCQGCVCWLEYMSSMRNDDIYTARKYTMKMTIESLQSCANLSVDRKHYF